MDRSSIWKIFLIIGIILSLIAFILGWIGFSVPDWHAFQHYNGSIQEYYGLWAYCQDQNPDFGSVCQRWPSAANELFNGNRPDFIRTTEGLITTGMILLSFGLFFAILAAILPLLSYLAAGLAFLAFIFLVIGLPIFGRQSNSLSVTSGDVSYNKRYGFWLMVPTIVLEFLAILFFLLAAVSYHFFGYGNIATGSLSRNRTYGGQRRLGPANVLVPPAYGSAPYVMGPGITGTGGIISNPYPNPNLSLSPNPNLSLSPYSGLNLSPFPNLNPYAPAPNQAIPSLLSQYLSQRPPRSYAQDILRATGGSVLPQPSVVRAMTSEPGNNVAPAYLRMGEPIGPRFTPIINLSGQTIVGPIVRST